MGSTGKSTTPSRATEFIAEPDILTATPAPTTEPEAESLPESRDLTSRYDVMRLQAAMGQDGTEAGDPDAAPRDKLYVNTGKSFNINAYLNSDGATYKSKDSTWNDLISERWVQAAIRKVDAGMRPLSESIHVTRFVSKDALGKMFGDSTFSTDFNRLVSSLGKDKDAGRMFTDMLKGVDYTHKGYTSTSYVTSHGSYGDRDVVLNMVMRKGTPSVATSNYREHEILGGRNLKYNFTGGWRVQKSSTGKDQLVLDVYV